MLTDQRKGSRSWCVVNCFESCDELSKCAEPFWVDLVLRNPLNVEVAISGLTAVVRDAKVEGDSSTPDFVETEVIDDLTLGAKECRTVSVLKASPHCHRSKCFRRYPSQSNAKDRLR